ncbi:MAG: helix-turn-helix domain-containing protein [Rhodocyclales bacterium]|nr:helix-turn-helix domain-containing protein [Rhodocyclales bacterium]
MASPQTPLDPAACYQAVLSRDARFDGHFFTAVKTTGIYCRPVCKVRSPLAKNCLFFASAARAEGAGFRPCLRCRPELAPAALTHWSTQDASQILAMQAMQLLDSAEALADAPLRIADLAARLGVSERHMHRILTQHLGVTPSQYRQTRRLLLAKQLLCDTALPIARIALLSGFASQRRFNTAFASHYRLTPSACRREGQAASDVRLKLAYRPPYDEAAMMKFLAQRAVPGLELCTIGEDSAGDDSTGEDSTGEFVRIVRMSAGKRSHLGWVRLQFEAAAHRVHVQLSDSLLPVLPAVLQQVRWALDLDADPLAIEAVLARDFAHCAGWRVPGAWDGFELAVRAVLGQQVTVAAARTLTRRLVQTLGEPLVTPWPQLTHAFPTPTALLQASADELGQLGIVRQRQKAIQALAQAVLHGGLDLKPGPQVQATVLALMGLPGIGEWTAQYIAMRALRWPDAFPAGDIVVQQRLGVRDGPQPARAATALASAWQPWRSYAVIRLWHGGSP